MIKRYTKALCFALLLLLLGEEVCSQNISINTSGAANSTLSILEVLQISTTASTKGLHISHTGTIAGTGYGLWAEKTGGAGTTNIAGYFTASGLGTNYAIIVPSTGGSVGIGTIAPADKLEVSGGDIKITNSAAYNGAVYSGDVNWGFKIQRTAATDDYNVRMSYYPTSGTRRAGIYNANASTWVLYADQNATPNIIMNNITNVGIGTAGPLSKLHTTGNLTVGNAATVGSVGNVQITTGGASPISNRLTFGTDGTGWKFAIGKNQAGTVTEYMTMQDNGNVGIGTTSPNEQLEITKNFRLPATTGSTVGVIYSGASRYIHNYGTANFFAGVGAGNFTMTGVQNTAVGYFAFTSNATGTSNAAIGRNTLYSNTDGVQNTAMGESALYTNTTGNSNTATGQEALYYNTTGSWNTATGQTALKANTTGNFNTAIGQAALVTNTGGGGNTASGVNALYFNSTGSNNTANGINALYSNTTGNSSTANGKQSLYFNTIGSSNTANGEFALYANVAGSNATAIGNNAMQYSNSTATAFTNYNVAVGFEALRGSVTAASNTGNGNSAIGYQTLRANTSGALNTATGVQALYNNATGTSNTATGYQALYTMASGTSNTATGYQALYFNNAGVANSAFGESSLTSNTTGQYNTALGYWAYWAAAQYNNSMALGANAYNITASNMIKVGDANITYIGGKVGWTTISDARIKKNVQANVPGLAFIKELRPVTYYYDRQKENELCGIRDTTYWEGKYDIDKILFSGFLAQEVEAAAKKIGYDFSGVSKTSSLWGLKYGEFTVPLVKAVQELNAKNEEQLKEIETQKKAIEQLLKRVEALENSKNPK